MGITSLSFWILMGKFVLLFGALAQTGNIVYKTVKAEKKRWTSSVLWGLISVLIFFFLFISYGPEKVELQSEMEPIGHMKMLDAAPAENIDSVRKVTEESRPEVLKRQDDPSFEKEKKEADKFLKSIGAE